jgi:fucose permease
MAAWTSVVGPVALLSLQAALLVLSSMMMSKLVITTPFTIRPAHLPRMGKIWHELSDGVSVVWNHERLRTIILYLMVGAPVFNGVFLVGFPLMVRDVFHGSSAMLATVVTAFLTGLTMSAFGISRLPPTRRPGRLLMVLSANNVLVFTLAHVFPDPAIFVALMFAWGLTSGVGMSLTRGMIQIAAPNDYRARVMSILQFSQMAGGPVGALLFGAVAQAIGILDTILIIPASVVLIWIVFRFTTNLWHFEREDQHPHAA